MSTGSPDTLIEALYQTAGQFGSKEFVRYHDGDGYVGVSFDEFTGRVERVAAALVGMGLEPGERVAILGENCLEWCLADYAIMGAGLVSVPIYTSLPTEQIAYILEDSEARAIVVWGEDQAAKMAGVQAACPQLAHFIWAGSGTFEAVTDAVRLEEILSSDPDEGALAGLASRRDAVRRDDVVTLIYTSGTTGRPKGVILTHDNFLSNVRCALQALSVGSDDLFLSFLPLSHAFERMAGHFLPMTVGATVAYSRGLRYLGRELAEVAPTLMACVPRFYESLQEKVLKAVETSPPARQRIFGWSMGKGRERSRRVLAGRRVGIGVGLACAVADRLVFQKLRANVGGRLRFFISGGAPLAESTAEFFHAAGILILEGYGLSETSPVISVNREDQFRFGTVGPPIPGIEVRIAEDGEVLTRGPHVMRGYFNLDEETADMIDGDGWLHTGDLGDLTDGFLRITGRKKSLFKLSNGKYIAPEPIENGLKASRFVQEAVVIGESRKVAGVIIAPAFDALEAFAADVGLSVGSREELVESPDVRKLYRAEVDGLTGHLADFERLRVLLLMPREFSIEAGELTPTLKVKRAKVLGALAEQIEEAYAGTT